MSQFRQRAPQPIRPHVSLRLRELAAAVTSLNMDLAKLSDRCLAAEARVVELEAENERLTADLRHFMRDAVM